MIGKHALMAWGERDAEVTGVRDLEPKPVPGIFMEGRPETEGKRQVRVRLVPRPAILVYGHPRGRKLLTNPPTSPLTGPLRIHCMESGVTKIPGPVRGTSACVQVSQFTILVVVQNINGQAVENTTLPGPPSFGSSAMSHHTHPGISGMFYSPLKWDAASQTCWYNNADQEARFRWLMGIQTSWIITFAMGEVSAFLIILGYLVTHEQQIHLLRCPAHTEAMYSEGAGSTILKFRNIILRIGLYPLVLCMFNLTGAVINLYESHLGVCARRPLIYGLLAATDLGYRLSTIVDIPPHETCPYNSGALHNDCAQQEQMRAAHESSTAPERDLGMGKRWRPYLGHDTNLHRPYQRLT
ncbi:hypothetical protein DFH08DRAFT_990266 [Mycena albidolilacea]|uniref:Uncharacterized protein n=1 Tax=Mycena albidolilacea TaxID=1033008 RepID=A0AAD7A8G7_9AGAR|nr:hypothetical protein DFH08DRAFT_990266 [Mycena albidolilacea]